MKTDNLAIGRLLVVVSVALCALAGLVFVSADANVQNMRLVRVGYAGPFELHDLMVNYDVWEVEPRSQTVLIAIENDNVGKMVADGWSPQAEPELTDFHFPSMDRRTAETFFGGYKTNDEIVAELQLLASTYPTLTELVDYGDSLCKLLAGCVTPGGDTLPGRDLLALRISNEAITGTSTVSGTQVISGSKPVYMIHSGLHSREIAVQETSLRFGRWMLENYDVDPAVKPIVDWQETWIIPVANPDGYDVVFLGMQPGYGGTPLLHRKNGRVTNGCFWPSSVSNQFGVDLNRNHSFGWGPIGTSTNPCSQVFNGAGGGSEPETADYEALLRSLVADQRGPNRTDSAPADTVGMALTLHSYGEVIIYPWGDGLSPETAPNGTELVAIANRLGSLSSYGPIQGNDFGSVSGASDDHVYGEFGIPSMTFEIGTTFLQSYSYTSNTIWAELRPALLYAGSITRAPYQLVNGPELSGITYTVSANQLTISGTASDVANGNDLIQTVQAQLDQPFALGATTLLTVTAADGAFDAPTESFTISSIDLTQFEACTIDLYFEAVDATAQTGPVQAITVETGSCSEPEPTPTPAPTPSLEQSYFPIVIRD